MLLTSFAGCGNKKAASHDTGTKVEQSAKDSAKDKTKATKKKTGEEKLERISRSYQGSRERFHEGHKSRSSQTVQGKVIAK